MIIVFVTGESKGYGLIKYLSSDASAQARHLLDGRLVGPTHEIDCDWLNSSHISFASLHSKTLYVDCLPQNFRDMKEFRRMFSVITATSYCHVSFIGQCTLGNETFIEVFFTFILKVFICVSNILSRRTL